MLIEQFHNSVILNNYCSNEVLFFAKFPWRFQITENNSLTSYTIPLTDDNIDNNNNNYSIKILLHQ